MDDDEAAKFYEEPANRRIVGPPQRRLSPELTRLRDLVTELNEAEFHDMERTGAVSSRLHHAIVAVCKHVGVTNRWNQEP